MKSPRSPFAITILLLAAAVSASSLAGKRSPVMLARPLEDIARTIAGWSFAANSPLDPEVLGLLRPTSYLSRVYHNGHSQLELLVVYYADQRAGETMHSPEHCLPGGGWRIDRRDRTELPMGSQKVAVNRYSISHGEDRRIMYYWYQSRRRVIDREYLGKLLLVYDTLATGQTEGSLVRVTVPDDPAADRGARDFAAAALLEMQRCFPR